MTQEEPAAEAAAAEEVMTQEEPAVEEPAVEEPAIEEPAVEKDEEGTNVEAKTDGGVEDNTEVDSEDANSEADDVVAPMRSPMNVYDDAIYKSALNNSRDYGFTEAGNFDDLEDFDESIEAMIEVE